MRLSQIVVLRDACFMKIRAEMLSRLKPMPKLYKFTDGPR